MSEILVADIGGTNSRIAFVRPGERPQTAISQTAVNIADSHVANLEDLLARVLANRAPPQAAILAVAGPVNGEEFTLTNRDWRIRPAAIAHQFNIPNLHVVNDFEALAYAIPKLEPGDLRPLGDVHTDVAGPRIVIGPGTGMGVAAILTHAERWQVIPSEGGHISFGPAYADEEPIFRRIAEREAPLSVESLLSGRGLSHLHAAMHPGTMLLKPEMVLTQARAGDREARATIAMFVRLLGRFAGDMALVFKATGGAFVAGGVARAMGDLIDGRIFRAAFERHPPYEHWLKKIPSWLITCPEPGLIGGAVLGEQLMRNCQSGS